nr:helix-turn-helix transcriptional regulator [Mesorhizobium sp.]
MIGLSQAELARRAGVSIPTIKRSESGNERAPVVSIETQDKIRAVFAAEGVEFTNGNHLGVRMRRKVEQHATGSAK